jgi:hypothetical protein
MADGYRCPKCGKGMFFIRDYYRIGRVLHPVFQCEKCGYRTHNDCIIQYLKGNVLEEYYDNGTGHFFRLTPETNPPGRESL